MPSNRVEQHAPAGYDRIAIRTADTLAFLRETKDVAAVREVHAQASAVCKYLELKGDGQAIAAAGKVKIEAEARLGELLAALELSKGGRPSRTGNTVLPVSKLSDLQLAELDADLAAARQSYDDLQHAWAVASHTSSGTRRPEDLDVDLARVAAVIAALEERREGLLAAPANDAAPARPHPLEPASTAPAPLPEWLDTEQAAALLGMTKKGLEGQRRRGGGLPFKRFGKKLVRYRREDVLKGTVQTTVQREPSKRGDDT